MILGVTELVDYSKVGRHSKTKGSNYELAIAKILTAWWGAPFHRVPASGGLHWNASMNVSGDIITIPEAGFPFVVECKKREEWTLENAFLNNKEIKLWWSQVVGDARETGKIPMLIFSRNRAENFVMLPYNEDFIVNFRTANPRVSSAEMYVEYLDEMKRPHGFMTHTILLKDLATYPVKEMQQDFDPEYYNWEEASMLTNRNGEYEEELKVEPEDMEDHIANLINKSSL